MRTSNPVLTKTTFEQARGFGQGASMTLQGAVNKTMILLFLLVVSASWVWSKVVQPVPVFEGLEGEGVKAVSSVGPLIIIGMIGGLITGLVTILKKDWSPVTAPVYAVCQGLFLGGISAIYEMQYHGIVFQAVGLTTATLFCLLMAYKSGIIKVTQNFRLGIVAATGAICLVYLANWIMSFFGGSIHAIYSNGIFGIGFSLVVVTVAALSLVLDFDFIEQGASHGAPKYMEWYSAFGLMVTLIWLYLEILRLLSKLRSRD